MYTSFKRFMDILLSGIMLAVGIIPMLVVALLIKFDSQGPVLLKKER